MNKQKISDTIRKKPPTSLKVSLWLFIFALVLLCPISISIQQRYALTKVDYVDDDNTNIVNVSFKLAEGTNQIDPLYFEDEAKIKDIIKDIDGTYSYSEYVIPVGILDENENSYSIKAVDNSFLEKAGFDKINDNEGIVSNVANAKDVSLKVPVMLLEDDGLSSSNSIDMNLSLVPTTTDKSPFDEFDIIPQQVIVNSDTYGKIIELMYDVSWDKFKADNASSIPYVIQPIESINVCVEDPQMLEEVADKLLDEGYQASYTVDSYQEIKNFLDSLLKIYSFALIFIFLVTYVLTTLSFKKYINTMQKDIGTLKNYGYSSLEVYNIYKPIVTKPAKSIALVITMYSLVLSYLSFKQALITPFIITIGLLAIAIGILVITLLNALKKLCDENTATLLNINEVEVNELKELKEVKQYDEFEEVENSNDFNDFDSSEE